MTSIRTNGGATTALQTLRSLSANLNKTQETVSTGLRISKAADNAAYWSISTTMRSDRSAVSAVSDAMGIGAAKVDTAYSGMTAVAEIISDFKSKIVAAKEDGVDKGKIQTELEQLKAQVQSIANSASFSGQNWLTTDVEDIHDDDINKVSVVSSFVRSPNGSVAVKTSDIHLSEISLFNSTGGGLLQPDNRAVWTIGGIRSFDTFGYSTTDKTAYYTDDNSGWMYPRQAGSSNGFFYLNGFPAGSPLDFNAVGAEISFDLLLDKEASNPENFNGPEGNLQELPGPYYSGYSTHISITKAQVDAYDSSLNGVISTNTQFAAVLNSVLNVHGASVSASYGMYDPPDSMHWVHDPKAMSIETLENHGDGSYVEISNLASVGVSNGGLKEKFDYGSRGSGLALKFEPFALHIDGDNKDGVSVTFEFSYNGASPKSYTFDRTYVNTLLGKETGKTETNSEMVTLLHSLLDADWPDLVIDASGTDAVVIKSDPDKDRKFGLGTNMQFDHVRVSIEPLPAMSFMKIDIAKRPEAIDNYLNYLEVVSQNIATAGSILGSLQSRIDMQSQFSARLIDSIDNGIGLLVDADMEETSSKLNAVQVQQQLALQFLSIANASSSNLLSLFR